MIVYRHPYNSKNVSAVAFFNTGKLVRVKNIKNMLLLNLIFLLQKDSFFSGNISCINPKGRLAVYFFFLNFNKTTLFLLPKINHKTAPKVVILRKSGIKPHSPKEPQKCRNYKHSRGLKTLKPMG